MGKLIVVVGNSGVGKTTLVQLLRQCFPLSDGLEQHAERPFQQLFSLNRQRWGFANQVDYLLFRAGQELSIRKDKGTGIQDGGLDEDFFVFTRLFYQKGYLEQAEMKLCERLYTHLRAFLPLPDLIISLRAPLSVVAGRFARRGRALEIAALEDLSAMQNLLDDWLVQVPPASLLTIDASPDDPGFSAALPALFPRVAEIL